MSRPIAVRRFDPDEYREHVRTLSDEELITEGKIARKLFGGVITTVPCAFEQQWRLCREEYRRRHPKA